MNKFKLITCSLTLASLLIFSTQPINVFADENETVTTETRVENEDGSKSVLIGDVDQMYGTKEITKFTLYPDKAYIEITGQLYNRTPLPQTFLWWANPAVPVNDYTQSIFPPDVHSVYDHGKRAVSRFPIATGEYYKHDYSEGVDISRYKNIPVLIVTEPGCGKRIVTSGLFKLINHKIHIFCAKAHPFRSNVIDLGFRNVAATY